MPIYSVSHYVSPPGAPTLEAYDYLLALCRRDWCWEGLRRNPQYQDEARSQSIKGYTTTRLEGGAIYPSMHY